MGALGSNSSNSTVQDFYGGQSAANARRYQSQFAGPMSQAFGWNPRPGFLDTLAQRAGEGNPFAQFMQNTRGLFAPMQADAAKAGQEVASRAPAAYQAYMGQAQGYLNHLPEWLNQVGQGQATVGQGVNTLDRAVGNVNTAGAQHGVDVAGQMLNESRSPIQANALYQNALRQATMASQGGAAGRGLLDAGSQQGREDALARDLAAQSGQNQFANQQAALQGYGNALGTQGNLAGLLGNLASGYGGLGQAQGQLAGMGAELGQSGIGVGQGMMQALPAYAQLLMAGSQLPFQTAQQLQGFLGASQNPTLALLQATAPQLGQESKGWHA